ncbi:hypothetical protein [Duganella sp. S19_KUP01_CR8]|uniref:hypothetical protein n=1 Tax=Duganella sp. S19_KUP01_CR8 TaxID=3025502 RepID=UPI002FCDC831
MSMINSSPVKVSNFVGKLRCSAGTVDALLRLDWQKPNPHLMQAEPLDPGERSQVFEAMAWSPEIVRVGPLTGLEKVDATAYADWTRDTFYPGKAFIGAPNALLLNTAQVERSVALRRNPGVDTESDFVLACGEALIFPINHTWFKTQGEEPFMILRGFFVSDATSPAGTGDV